MSTCSVELSYNPATGLQADARLGSEGMLECIGDGTDPDDGLGLNAILKFNDVAAGDIDECGLLGRSAANELFASRPGVQRFNMSDGRKDLPEATLVTVDVGDIENLSDCWRVAIFDAQYNLIFTVSPNAGDRFYNFDLECELFVNGISEHTFTTNYNGVTPPVASSERRITPRRFDNFLLPPGATLPITMTAEITSGTGSLTGNVDAAGGDNGIFPALQGVVLDLDSVAGSLLLPDLVTVT
jgi:hypothetical protein